MSLFIKDDLDLNDLPNNAAVTAAMAIAGAEATHEIKTIQFAGKTLLSVPPGRTLEDYERFLPAPHRIKGNQPVNDADSFLKQLARFEGWQTYVAFSKSSLKIQAIFNGAHGTNPGWADHTATWQLALHRDFKAWIEFCKKPVTQLEFMEFLEDHLVDIQQDGGSPSQSDMESVISALEVSLDSKFESKRDLHSGSYVLHSNCESRPSQTVPKSFKIGVPIFEGLKEAYLVTIRLRYRVTDGKLMFIIAIQHYDAIVDESWESVTKTITTRLPEGVSFINVP